MKLLVVGATGALGRDICRRARARGHAVLGTVRPISDPAAVQALHDMEVETAEVDLTDPASLERALAGVYAVVSGATAIGRGVEGQGLVEVDRDGHLELVRRAAALGVDRFVYVSFSGSIGGAGAMTRAKRAIEQELINSGMNYTILRPTMFMESWLAPHTGFDYVNSSIRVYGAGDQPISYIARDDVAEFAMLALERDEPRGEVLELGGPEPVTPLEAIRIFEEETGRSFEVQHVPVQALEQQRDGATEPRTEAFATFMLRCAAGDPVPMDETLARYPVKLRSVREYARAAAQT